MRPGVVVSSSAINGFEVRMEGLLEMSRREYGTNGGCRSKRRERDNTQPANVVLEVGRQRERCARERGKSGGDQRGCRCGPWQHKYKSVRSPPWDSVCDNVPLNADWTRSFAIWPQLLVYSWRNSKRSNEGSRSFETNDNLFESGKQ